VPLYREDASGRDGVRERDDGLALLSRGRDEFSGRVRDDEGLSSGLIGREGRARGRDAGVFPDPVFRDFAGSLRSSSSGFRLGTGNGRGTGRAGLDEGFSPVIWARRLPIPLYWGGAGRIRSSEGPMGAFGKRFQKLTAMLS